MYCLNFFFFLMKLLLDLIVFMIMHLLFSSAEWWGSVQIVDIEFENVDDRNAT